MDNLREKTNKFILRSIKRIKTFFGHKIYAYTSDESGFIVGFHLDKYKRRFVSLQVKCAIHFDHAKATMVANTPATRIKCYRLCYSPFQLFLGKIFGVELKNKNRRLRKWK